MLCPLGALVFFWPPLGFFRPARFGVLGVKPGLFAWWGKNGFFFGAREPCFFFFRPAPLKVPCTPFRDRSGCGRGFYILPRWAAGLWAFLLQAWAPLGYPIFPHPAKLGKHLGLSLTSPVPECFCRCGANNTCTNRKKAPEPTPRDQRLTAHIF